MSTLIEKVFRKCVYCYLSIKGFKPYMANHYSKLLTSDFFESKLKFGQKIWAYKKGFLSQRIIHYGINDENYKDFLSDWDYYKMFPLNGIERKWIDDKLTTKYVLAPYDEFLPAYYFMINGGKVTPLHNMERNKTYTLADVMDKLKAEKILAMKREAGFGGEGFYKLEYCDNDIIVNRKKYTEAQFTELLSSLSNYLIMEYITAHSDIKKYYAESTGVLRIMVINEGTPQIANAHLRIGSSKSGIIDAYDGSISSVVDIETGKYSEAWITSGHDYINIKFHPDTNLPLSGTIPKWEYVKEKILEISAYMPQLAYLGYDVCVTESGFKIYEINSHQGISLYQLTYPLLKDNEAADFFKSHIK